VASARAGGGDRDAIWPASPACARHVAGAACRGQDSEARGREKETAARAWVGPWSCRGRARGEGTGPLWLVGRKGSGSPIQ
jgi:hypothetical protein